LEHNYTRQRQGRDFAPADPHKSESEKKSVLAQLASHAAAKRQQAEIERNKTPIDGREPAPERGI
jgi:hypothetical protein